MAFKVFTNGSTLQASEVNENLMRQAVSTFSNAAARTAAITAPSEGMLTYLEDLNRYDTWNSSSWVPAFGLSLIKSQTIGTAVSSVSVTDVFSSAYDNYKVIVSGGNASSNGYLQLRLAGSTTGYSSFMFYGAYNTNTVLGAGISNGNGFDYAGGTQVGQYIYMNADLLNPFDAKFTNISANTTWQTSSGGGLSVGVHAVATSYTGITIAPTAGTITGGTISVYGYKKA